MKLRATKRLRIKVQNKSLKFLRRKNFFRNSRLRERQCQNRKHLWEISVLIIISRILSMKCSLVNMQGLICINLGSLTRMWMILQLQSTWTSNISNWRLIQIIAHIRFNQLQISLLTPNGNHVPSRKNRHWAAEITTITSFLGIFRTIN